MLYISFQKPQQADDSQVKDNLVYHYRGQDLVGVTIIGAKSLSSRKRKARSK